MRDVIGNNVILSTRGDLLQVKGAKIKSHNLDITALGSVGTAENPLIVDVDGTLRIRSLYGRVFYNNLFRILTPLESEAPDEGRQMTFIYSDKGGALGFMSPKASFVVTELTDKPENQTDSLLRKASESDSCINAMDVSILNPNGTCFDEKVFLLLEADGCETGTELFALHNRNGELELLKGYVWNGYAVFATQGLSQDEASGFVMVTKEGLGELGLDADTAASGGLNFSEQGLGILNGAYLDGLVRILVEARTAASMKEAA